MYDVQLGISVETGRDLQERCINAVNLYRIEVNDTVVNSIDIEARLMVAVANENVNEVYDLDFIELAVDGLQKEIKVSRIFR